MPQGHSVSDLKRRLEEGARILGLPLTSEISEQLLRFLSLLVKWNKAYNLTALDDPMEMVERHLLDSLSVLDYLHGNHILDMGTGPGLPGIPLALLCPQRRFVLLDSNGKKIRFVRQAMLELRLDNVQPVHARVEQYLPQRPFDTIIARAFTALPRMLELTARLRVPGGCLLAMKGVVPVVELEQLSTAMEVRVIPLRLPFSQAERHLIKIT